MSAVLPSGCRTLRTAASGWRVVSAVCAAAGSLTPPARHERAGSPAARNSALTPQPVKRQLAPCMCFAGRCSLFPLSTAGDWCATRRRRAFDAIGWSVGRDPRPGTPNPASTLPARASVHCPASRCGPYFPLKPCRPGSVSFLRPLRREAPPSSSSDDPTWALADTCAFLFVDIL